jgi:DNA-binding GntR family transcriptional regulator
MPPPNLNRKSKGDAAAPDGVLAAALSNFKLDTERSYTAQVHEVLQQSILRGKIAPKTALSEATISTVLNVSRTPVREALAQLADEQLVLIYRQVGTIVAPVRVSLIEEGRFVRSTLECANHVNLVQTISPEQLAEFGRIVEQQRNAVAAGEIDSFFALRVCRARPRVAHAGAHEAPV